MSEGLVSWAEVRVGYIRAFRVSPVRAVLSDISGVLTLGGIFHTVDEYYKPITDDAEARFKELLKTDLTDREKWVKWFFDCDDHTYRLHGAIHRDRELAAMPFFLTWIDWFEQVGFVRWRRVGHYVETYYKDGLVSAVEPQTDLVSSVPSHWRLRGIDG